MSLDDDHMTTRRMMVEMRNREQLRELAEWQHEQMMESPEAEDARHRNRMAQQAREETAARMGVPVYYPDAPGLDRRLHAVDGDTDRRDQ